MGEPIQESTRWSLGFPYSIGGPHKCAEMFAVFSAARAHELQNPAAFRLQNVAHSEHKARNSAMNISKNESSFERVKFALYWQYHIDQVIKSPLTTCLQFQLDHSSRRLPENPNIPHHNFLFGEAAIIVLDVLSLSFLRVAKANVGL